MRPVNKDNPPKDLDGQEITFKEYQYARRYLIDAIGEYCSYCERKLVANLAVEHVQPKSLHRALELKWSNFLLGCTNCNSTKGADDIVLDDYFWADRNGDNTYSVFSYDNSGMVNVSVQITNPLEIKKAKDTIALVGLDKQPPTKGTIEWKKASDRRFEQRIQAFENAKDYADKYASASQEVQLAYLDCFKTIVINQGFWSIWMRAFERFPEVQKELINSFKGTRIEFFQDILN